MDFIRTDAYIDGQWVTAAASFPVYNPATGEKLADVADCGIGDAEKAIEAAHAAFPLWRDMLAQERADILLKWRDLIVEHKQKLAELLTREQGKPLAEALTEIGRGESLSWSAEEGKRVLGMTVPPFKKNTRVTITKQPVGVVSAITPWNFPHSMITRKVGPALAAGCTVVLKPAEDTPLSALALADLAEQAGLPKGVLNIVTCSAENAPEIGKILTTHPNVRKISFTGSTQVGKILMKQGADTVKKISMELGGNAPFIVFDSADLEQAVQGAVASKFRNTGQTCICANRIFVQSGIYDAFTAALAKAVSALKTGNGMGKNVEIGPMINQSALDKVEKFVSDAKSKGAEVLIGGQPVSDGELFYQPTVLSNMTKEMLAFRDEIFGPVAPLYRFDTEEEAIALANDTQYGLAAYFYSQDLGQCFRVSERLEYGMVGINEPFLAHASVPFGGVKESGTGREGGPGGLDDFLETKYILLVLPDGKSLERNLQNNKANEF